MESLRDSEASDLKQSDGSSSPVKDPILTADRRNQLSLFPSLEEAQSRPQISLRRRRSLSRPLPEEPEEEKFPILDQEEEQQATSLPGSSLKAKKGSENTSSNPITAHSDENAEDAGNMTNSSKHNDGSGTIANPKADGSIEGSLPSGLNEEQNMASEGTSSSTKAPNTTPSANWNPLDDGIMPDPKDSGIMGFFGIDIRDFLRRK